MSCEEHVKSAVIAVAVTAVVSFLVDKYEDRTRVSDKIQRLEWKLLKIQSAVEESNKYEIDHNKALQKMQQKLLEALQEGNEVLHEFKPEYLRQALAVQNPTIPTIEQPQTLLLETSESLLLKVSAVFDQIHHHRQDFILKMKDNQKLNRILERVEGISGDINDFLEMLRHQKRKRERRRYRQYKGFFMLAYLDLVQDALGYWWVHASWMQFLVPEIVPIVETKEQYSLMSML